MASPIMMCASEAAPDMPWKVPDIFSVLPMEEKNMEQVMVQGQVRKDLRKLVELLPAEQREVLMMRHYYDMSFKEISEQTNVSINTALGRMRYALINLRKMIEEDRYCLDILTQIDALRAALARVQSELLKDHLGHCIEGAILSGDQAAQREKAKELIELLDRTAR